VVTDEPVNYPALIGEKGKALSNFVGKTRAQNFMAFVPHGLADIVQEQCKARHVKKISVLGNPHFDVLQN
jgi:hypothetical protein